MAAIIIKEYCPKCKGTGIDVPYNVEGAIEKPCENCGATGVREKAHSDDLGDKFDALQAWCTTVNQKLLYLKEKIDAL